MTGILIAEELKTNNEISTLPSPTHITQMSATDNTYNYQNMGEPYINGNVVRVATVSLPVFIKPTNPVVVDKNKIEETSKPEESVKSIRPGFKVPLLVNVNRWVQVALIALCSLAVLAYSLDVMVSHDVMLRQEQVRRLSEQNSELSARLLKSISFQGIQESVLGHGSSPANLHVADEVLIAHEVPPVAVAPFKPRKHHLPLLSGY